MRGKRLRIAIITGLVLSFSCISAGYGAAPIDDDDAFIAEEATLPVAPDQIESSAKGAGALLPKGRFEAFNALHEYRWKANINKKDGRVRILYGNMSRRYPGDPEKVALGFLKDGHALFGLRDDLADLKTLRTDKTLKRNHVKLQQTVEGVPVSAAFVLVHASPDGQVSMVQNDYLPDLQVANRRMISREEAEAIALDDLQRSRRTEGVISAPRAEEMVVAQGTAHIFIWKVTAPTQKPYGLWIYHIDAENGAIRYVANEIKSLKKGVGNVYKSNRAWKNNSVKQSSLPYLFTVADGYAEGWLWGLHGDIYDDQGNDPYAPNFKFNYNPHVAIQKPWFDATSAYYQMNRLWKWWEKKILTKYVAVTPDYFYTLSIPVVVNVEDLCNAYYLSDLVDGLPGFVFGNEGSCAPWAEDLVLDQSVVSHEYAHAMMDWCGFDEQFDSELDQYGRAMGEGNADWFAFLYTKNHLVGDVALAWSANGYLRNLDNTRVYPADVDEPSAGVPEEHYTGEIWGGYLYDLSRVLKSRAVKFVYEGFFYFTPAGGHMPSLPDFCDAIYAQILAEQDLNDGRYKYAAKAWGAMSSRGINAVIRSPYSHPSNYFNTGAPGSDAIAYYAWTFPTVQRIKTLGRILKANDTNEFPINISEAGRILKVTVKAKSANMVPAVELRTTGDAAIATGTSTADSAQLEIPDIPLGEYVILLTANRGNYSIDIQVK